MSGAAVFSSLIGYRLFGIAAGWLTGLGFAFSGLVVFFAGLTVKTSAELFFIAGSSYFMIRFIQTRAMWRWCVCLVLLGLAVVDRNNYAVVLLVYGFYAWKHALAGLSTFEKGKKLVLPTAIAAAIAGIVGGWQADVVEQPFFSPVGLNVFIGNAPTSRGGYTKLEDMRNDIEGQYLRAASVAEKAAGRALTREEVSLYWIQRSWAHYSQHPLDYLILQGRKAMLLIAAESYGLPEQFAVWKWQRPALLLAPVSYALVLALAMTLFCRTRGWRENAEARLVFAALSAYVLAMWLFYVGERYRLPILMLLMPFAAQALLLIVRAAGWRQRAPLLAMVLGAFFLSHAAAQFLDPGVGWTEEPNAVERREQQRLDRLHDIYTAQERVGRTNDAEGWGLLARYALKRRFMPDARLYAERARQLAPDDASHFKFLANIYHLRGLRPELAQLIVEGRQHVSKTGVSEEWTHALGYVEFLGRTD